MTVGRVDPAAPTRRQNPSIEELEHRNHASLRHNGSSERL
jgi:hypothetical protein